VSKDSLKPEVTISMIMAPPSYNTRQQICKELSDFESYLAEALHGKDSAHHRASPLCGCEFGGDNGRERVVTANS
jgi:hypothetical protein